MYMKNTRNEHLNMPLKWKMSIFFLLLVLIVSSCGETVNDSVSTYDPSRPIELNDFMPDSGFIRTDFVIKGSNLGSESIRVLFSDDDREATIVNANNEAIYCLVPRQKGGNNQVKVVVGEDTTVFENTFNYTVKQAVSTVAGVVGETTPKDGTLSEARFSSLYGIAAVCNGDIIAVGTGAGNIRYVAVSDNSVTTLQTGFTGGTPARTADFKTIYIIQRNFPHKVYRYSESSLWEPELLVASISEFSGEIGSCALDGEGKWLHFFDTRGKYGRLELANPYNVEVLNEKVDEVVGGYESQIAYSAYDDCFFFSSFPKDAVYKVSKDGKELELYIGGNGAGNVFGDRLETAKLNNPAGLVIDDYGDIYIANVDGYTISKCDRKSGWVSLAAGVPGNGYNAHEDGDPLKAKFHLPYGISIDEEGNFIICECYAGGDIRKLAIE